MGFNSGLKGLKAKGTITADLNVKPKTDITCRLSEDKERP